MGDEKRDFFISYTRTDVAWAEWVDWELRQAGYTTFFQPRDIRPGSNFIERMDAATRMANRTIAVLTPEYFTSSYAMAEFHARLAQDPAGIERLVVPVRVRNCSPRGLAAPITYIDLVGLDEHTARLKLLEGLAETPPEGTAPPIFPGDAPLFPGPHPHPRSKVTAVLLGIVILIAATALYIAITRPTSKVLADDPGDVTTAPASPQRQAANDSTPQPSGLSHRAIWNADTWDTSGWNTTQ